MLFKLFVVVGGKFKEVDGIEEEFSPAGKWWFFGQPCKNGPPLGYDWFTLFYTSLVKNKVVYSLHPWGFWEN